MRNKCPLCKEPVTKRSLCPDTRSSAMVAMLKKLRDAYQDLFHASCSQLPLDARRRRSEWTHAPMPNLTQAFPHPVKDTTDQNDDPESEHSEREETPCDTSPLLPHRSSTVSILSTPLRNGDVEDEEDFRNRLLEAPDSQLPFDSQSISISTQNVRDIQKIKESIEKELLDIQEELEQDLPSSVHDNNDDDPVMPDSPVFNSQVRRRARTLASSQQENERIPSTPADSINTRRSVLLCSGLSTEENEMVNQFVGLVDGTVIAAYNDEVTHLIIKCEDEDKMLAVRTLKYFQTIAGGKWAVNVDWVRDSLKRGIALSENPYELQGDGDGFLGGPRRSRLSPGQLFDGWTIAFDGDSFDGICREAMSTACTTLGANIVQNIADIRKPKHVIVRGDGSRCAVNNVTLDATWILDSICSYAIQPMHDYHAFLEDST